ncbi:rhodanese domain protein / beta-lactamase domain protein (plasmid) [Natrialba magadii ATCC 43099]|uniref:Rhodanese domain protein / beta-lactamase domain protein n=1 Tax=Natrialba magadii (strain ATCC 43099 / DSM 3394 / CCM 3739 / CIP 104546 / IAM 13178 / JCM 8861 / NBRC 102185 / NCIMB 2190 / MS3) TaxID=547559 RepID=D3T221_NATMM|nr:rhodanese-like domain-containing protein [Natrialba magadii]ADD07630.1 rhodanese domain protein / beta-lactamase domain protein [Natrialba magadii ATCC 43099]ELY27108.1 Rhodanese domain-containing protein [Natrialba magadii ATCC 43099]
MTEITPETVAERLEQGDDDVTLVDVRDAESFAEWHVPGSEHIDVYDELQDDPEAAGDLLAELPEDEEIVTVCAAGVLAGDAADLLQERGYDASVLAEGMNGWARVHRHAELECDLEGDLIQVARPGTGCLSHVLVSEGEAAVFEPSQYIEEYEAILEEYDADLVGVFDTHAHADHVSGGQTLAEAHDVPYYLHPADDDGIGATHVEDGDRRAVGAVEVEVVHTPGHSPGSVTFAVESEALLTGDTLFHDSVGRVELGVDAGLEDTDVEDNAGTLYESLERLRTFEGDPLVLPAHDSGSPQPPVAARLSEVKERNEAFCQDRETLVAALAGDIPDQPANFERIKLANVGTEEVSDEEADELELGPNRCAAE